MTMVGVRVQGKPTATHGTKEIVVKTVPRKGPAKEFFQRAGGSYEPEGALPDDFDQLACEIPILIGVLDVNRLGK